jgi:hypothetical protein
VSNIEGHDLYPDHIPASVYDMSSAQFEKAVSIVQNLPKDGPIKPTQDEQLHVSCSHHASVYRLTDPRRTVLQVLQARLAVMIEKDSEWVVYLSDFVLSDHWGRQHRASRNARLCRQGEVVRAVTSVSSASRR